MPLELIDAAYLPVVNGNGAFVTDMICMTLNNYFIAIGVIGK